MTQPYSGFVIAAVVAYMIYYFARQVTWQRFRPRTVYTMPLVMLGGGVYLHHLQGPTLPTIRPLDVGVLVVELLAGVVVGCVLGSLTQFSRTATGLRYRLPVIGLAVWIGFIAVRVLVSYVLAGLGAQWAAAATSSFLLVLGTIRLGQLPFIAIRSHTAVPARAATR